MENFYRFFDEGHCISGIVIASNRDEATDRAVEYILGKFQHIKKEKMNIIIWEAINDDDYSEDYPYCLATNY